MAVPPATYAPTSAPEPRVPVQGEPGETSVVSLGVIGHVRRWLRIVFAFMLITVAAILGLVPLIPGWPLAIIGLSILAAEYAWARRLMKKLRRQGVRLRDASLFRRPKKPKTARPPSPPAA